MSLDALTVDQQLDVWDRRVTDPRGRTASGIPELDVLLHRGGFAPGEFAILGGRSGTRKTTLTVNLIAHLLQQGIPTGLVGLDESPANYVAKLCSAITGVSHEHIEDVWDTDDRFKEEYRLVADNFIMSKGYRPNPSDLDEWLEVASIGKEKPQVVFIDYASLLFKDKFSGAETKRIPAILEELQVWTNRHEIVTVCLHQVNRSNEQTGQKNHGDRPLTPEDLMYGGEAIADIILSTYRPARDPLGNMSYEEAEAMLGDKFDEEKYDAARSRVLRHKHHTFLQLIKNRPGTRLDEEGIVLESVGDSMQMVTEATKDVDLDEDMAFEEAAA